MQIAAGTAAARASAATGRDGTSSVHVYSRSAEAAASTKATVSLERSGENGLKRVPNRGGVAASEVTFTTAGLQAVCLNLKAATKMDAARQKDRQVMALAPITHGPPSRPAITQDSPKTAQVILTGGRSQDGRTAQKGGLVRGRPLSLIFV